MTFTDASGNPRRIDAAAIAGCDGSFGPSRAAMPSGGRCTWERVYPYSWLGILADVAPSTDELIYAWHPDGFAMHSMRSATVSRLYLQVPNGTDPEDWSDDRIWDALATRLGHGQDGWRLAAGPITDKSVLPMRSFVQSPMRHGRLLLAGDAAHTVPPTGAKGLNLAIADVALLAPALGRLIRANDTPWWTLLRHSAAPRLAVPALRLVDDVDAAHLRRPVRRPAPAVTAAVGGLKRRRGRRARGELRRTSHWIPVATAAPAKTRDITLGASTVTASDEGLIVPESRRARLRPGGGRDQTDRNSFITHIDFSDWYS